MKKLLYLFFVVILFIGCAGGYKITSGEAKLQINSEPSAADVEVIELNWDKGSSYDQSSLPPPSYKGITPMEVSFDLIGINNRHIGGYLIKYKKDGYLSEVRIVSILRGVKVDSAKETASKVLTPVAGFVPIFAIPAIMLGGSKQYTELSLSRNNINVIFEPVNSSVNTASNEVVTCLEHYLKQIALPLHGNMPKKPSFVKFIPSFWWLRWKGELKSINCNSLNNEIKQGKRISFAQGILKTRTIMYEFIEDSFIEQGEDGKIGSYGISVRPGY